MPGDRDRELRDRRTLDLETLIARASVVIAVSRDLRRRSEDECAFAQLLAEDVRSLLRA